MNARVLRTRAQRLLDAMLATRRAPGDALVVNGFWRSGTTWLMEQFAAATDARAVFEPFMAPARHIHACLDEMRVPRRDFPFVNALMPYAEGPLDPAGALYRLCRRALTGALPHASMATPPGTRRAWRDCLRPGVVTKFTRAALCADALVTSFDVPIVHVYRDPRAVVASILGLGNGNWAGRTFRDFPLAGHLLEIDDGRAATFAAEADRIHRYARSSDAVRLAAYWCYTERQVAAAAERHPARIHLVSFESLLAGGPTALDGLLSRCGRAGSGADPARFTRGSATDWAWRGAADTPDRERRTRAWRERMGATERDAVERVVDELGLSERLGPA